MTTEVANLHEDQRSIQYKGVRGEDVKLTIPAIRSLFNVPKASDHEIFVFMKLCEGHHLNPFLREIYIIKYDEKGPASYVVGKDTFTQRAEANPDFTGYRAGVIVQRQNQVVMEDGSFLLPGDVLLGGWFEGRRKRQDIPFLHKVAMQEYSTGQSSWRKMPATMIRKVAIVQGLREMFPTMFGGLYDSAELNVESVINETEPTVPLTEQQLTSVIPSQAPASDTNHEAIIEATLKTVAEQYKQQRDASFEPVTLTEGAAVTVQPGVQVSALGGIDWELNDRFQSWSARNPEGGWYKLGTWTKEQAYSVTGESDEETNAQLKQRYGVTASKLNPEQAGEYLASLTSKATVDEQDTWSLNDATDERRYE
jgi:phage recombination protein Bet